VPVNRANCRASRIGQRCGTRSDDKRDNRRDEDLLATIFFARHFSPKSTDDISEGL